MIALSSLAGFQESEYEYISVGDWFYRGNDNAQRLGIAIKVELW